MAEKSIDELGDEGAEKVGNGGRPGRTPDWQPLLRLLLTGWT